MVSILIVRLTGLLLTAAALASAQRIDFTLVNHPKVDQRLEAYTKKNAGREPALRQLFEDAGCKEDKLTEQPVKGDKSPNLICAMPGSSGRMIIVGAHFDFADVGHGVADNWSGASLLPSLYEGLASQPRRHTFRFVGFTGEEKGELGSKAYVRQALKNQDQIAAMVNLDTLGLGESAAWVSHADLQLVKLLGAVANATHLPISGVNVERVGTTDSEAFREKKIPAITIHSLTSETLPILHTPRDRIEVIQRDALYRSYNLVLAYLAFLDATLE